jgi:hypothetical protein
VEELVAQRVLALAQGYEDLNDHDALLDDTLLALAVGKNDLTGTQRLRGLDRGMRGPASARSTGWSGRRRR